MEALAERHEKYECRKSCTQVLKEKINLSVGEVVSVGCH